MIIEELTGEDENIFRNVDVEYEFQGTNWSEVTIGLDQAFRFSPSPYPGSVDDLYVVFVKEFDLSGDSVQFNCQNFRAIGS